MIALRQQPRYRQRRLNYVKTRPTAVTIGERRRPDPQGQPGYLRVDTVHQSQMNAGDFMFTGCLPLGAQRLSLTKSIPQKYLQDNVETWTFVQWDDSLIHLYKSYKRNSDSAETTIVF